jgi:hypothetical protein
MRMLLKAVMDTEVGNETVRRGAVAEALDQMRENLQPEAVYGVVEDGQRTLIVVFDLADPSQIPVACEGFFQQAKAKITLSPCMTEEEMKKGVDEVARRMQDMQGQSTE